MVKAKLHDLIWLPHFMFVNADKQNENISIFEGTFQFITGSRHCFLSNNYILGLYLCLKMKKKARSKQYTDLKLQKRTLPAIPAFMAVFRVEPQEKVAIDGA